MEKVMPVLSYVQEEGHGRGKGHTSHGKGKGLGHRKHEDEAMADGHYTMALSGISHDNAGVTSETSTPVSLRDGSTMTTEVRQGSITTELAPIQSDGDTTALRLETDSNNGRLRLNTTFDADNQVTLGDLDSLKFDYFVESSTRSDVLPTIRLIIDADGDLSTTSDRGELVFEYAYQGQGPVVEEQWQTADLVGGDWVAWQRSGGVNRDEIVNMTNFSDWADADGFTPGSAGSLNFNEDSLVLGWSVAYGSGNGTGVMYLDNLQVAGVTYEFA
jgi:hypothetical protein